MYRIIKLSAIVIAGLIFCLTIESSTATAETVQERIERAREDVRLAEERCDAWKEGVRTQSPIQEYGLNTPCQILGTKRAKLENLTYIASARDPSICISCKLIVTYANLTNEYVKALSEAIKPGMQVMFYSLLGLWVVLQGYRILFGIATPQQFVQELVYVVIAWLLLFNVGEDFVNQTYKASLSVMSGASSIAFVLAKDIDVKAVHETVNFAQYENLVRLVYTVEHVFYRVFDLASYIVSSNDAIEDLVLALAYALILIVPYFLMAIAFLSMVVISVFRLMMLAAFSPFLMMAYAFGWGRGMGQAALRALISSIAVMFAVTASVAMVTFVVNGSRFEYINTELSLSNVDLVILVVLGWMSTALMTEATGLANSITGSSFTNTGAGVLTAGLAGSAAFALKQKGLANPLGWGTKANNALDNVGRSGEGYKNLYEKFKSVSRGGGDKP